MNINNVKILFKLFSGFDCFADNKYEPVIQMSVNEVEGMLKPGTGDTDTRLCYLSAALANYRYRQIICAQDRSQVTFAGKINDNEHDVTLEYAEKLFRDYLRLCEDIVISTDFVFMSFGKGDKL